MAGFINPLTQNVPTKDPSKQNAFRKLVMGPNGTMIQYVDQNGQIVSNPAQYNIVDPQITDLESLGLLPTSNTQEQTQTNTSNSNTETTSGTKTPEYRGPGFNTNRGDAGHEFSGPDVSGKRDQSNNYGYFDKPGIMGFAGMLPGPLGIAGKGINAVANANNVGAVNAARKDIGVDPLGFGESLKGTINDRKGFVGNIDYTDVYGTSNNLPVSLEAVQNKSLSPDMIKGLPGDVSLSANQKDSNNRGAIRSFIDKLFGTDDTKSRDTETINSKAFGDITVEKTKTGGIYDKFPDAPKDERNPTHREERERDDSGRRSDLSREARDAVDRGTGGLY